MNIACNARGRKTKSCLGRRGLVYLFIILFRSAALSLERVQRRETKMGKGFEGKTWRSI